jgi:hypothetical protein
LTSLCAGFLGRVGRSLPLTILLLLALLATERRPERPATLPTLTPGVTAVLTPFPSSTPAAPATLGPTLVLTATSSPTARATVTLPPTETPMPRAQLATQPVRKTSTIAPTHTATRARAKTPTLAPSVTSTSTPTSAPTFTPPLIPTPTADAGQPVTQDRSHVPAAYEDTTLGHAVTEYNVVYSRMITMYVVGRDSTGMEGAMYHDLIERRLRIMGPEDFAGSAHLSGWPYLVVAIEEDLNANSVTGWRYVLEHERVHMVAASNLAAEGVNLAQLMRRPDGTFTNEALFHEVCADFYPRDQEGNHRPVASFYDAMNRMPELLRVLEEVDSAAITYQPPTHYEILPITGLSLVDAACVWDREAMQMVRELYDGRVGPGAFDALFPAY